MSETTRMHAAMRKGFAEAVTEAFQLEEELTALQSENAKLKADIAAKDAALQQWIKLKWDWYGDLAATSGLNYLDSLGKTREAVSPNPPVYVPGEIVEKLVVILGSIENVAPRLGLIEELTNEALALARPFITKGEKEKA